MMVEKAIPIPRSEGGGCTRYPFDRMEVGDSFSVGIEDWDRIRSAAYLWGKNHGKRFATRKIDGDGIRCWRVA